MHGAISAGEAAFVRRRLRHLAQTRNRVNVRLSPPKGPLTATPAEVSVPQPPVRWTVGSWLHSRPAKYVAKILLLAAAYYGSAKAGQALRYTASVSAVWPPAGVGIGALFLWGPSLGPGGFLARVALNSPPLDTLALGSLIGQQTGNMAEVIVGAVLLQRLLGPRAKFERSEQVSGMILAIGIATAISATVGTVSMLAGGVISGPDIPKLWRTWWLGDTAGGLVGGAPVVVGGSRAPRAGGRIPGWGRARVVAARA